MEKSCFWCYVFEKPDKSHNMCDKPVFYISRLLAEIMGKYKLTIEYEGTRYAGWQMQKGGKTIQGEILDACRELFKTESLDIFGADD